MSEHLGGSGVRIGGRALPEAAIAAEMQYQPAGSLAQSRLAAARALVVREMLCRRATELDLLHMDTADEPTIVAAIEAVLEQEVWVPTTEEAACRAWYAANSDELRSPDLLEAQHILFAAAPDDQQARAQALADATAILREVEHHPERFEGIARARSACPSAAQGGWLGQIVRGSTVPEFETYLFSLEEGEVCAAPVPTRYGYHVVRLLRRANGRTLPYEAVRARIARRLEEKAYRNAIRDYIDGLAARYGVEGFDALAH